MAGSLPCPHCQNAVVMRELRHPGLFANYRRCPHCRECFTVDPDTKRRQALCIVIALISLLFTVLLYFDNPGWLIPALTSYAVLAILIYHGNKQVSLVPWSGNESRDD
jgi:hypothetical protein